MKSIVLSLAVVCLLAVAFLSAPIASGSPAPAAAASAPAPAATTASAAASAPTSEETPEGCIQEKFTVPSPSMKRQIQAAILLPPGYKANPDKKYPVVFALHGMGAPYEVYVGMNPIRRALRERPMIIASFSCDRAGWYVDSPRKPENQFRTFFFDEFIPYIDSHYRTNGQRALMGFSMGGFGSFHYLLCKPEMFCSASAQSGAFFRFRDPNGRGPGFLRELIGDPAENAAVYANLDIQGRIEEYVKKGVHLPPMMMHCGTEDGLIQANREMAKFLTEQNKLIAEQVAKDPSVANETDRVKKGKALGALMLGKRINFWLIESPGAHDYLFWRDSSEMLLDFHWRSFRDARPAGK